MSEIVIDIETMPIAELALSLPEPEYKYGNTKDEAKQEVIRQEAKARQKERMALDPLYGRIAAYSVSDKRGTISGTVVKDTSDAEEINILNEILPFFGVTQFNVPTIITFNGVRFDVPFIFKRAMMLKVPLPAGVPKLNVFMKRYSMVPHCDLAMQIVNWDNNDYCSLDNTCRGIIGKRKMDFDVTKIREMILNGEGDKVLQYNMSDVELTMELYKTVSDYLF